jgi:DNA invertase Pin-like site-specific DNA recombinase
MSTRQSSTPLRAACYYRCSSLKQTDSIDRQKSQVEPLLTDLGHIPAGVYEEPGIPGDEFARRPALQRLLRDAKAKNLTSSSSMNSAGCRVRM